MKKNIFFKGNFNCLSRFGLKYVVSESILLKLKYKYKLTFEITFNYTQIYTNKRD